MASYYLIIGQGNTGCDYTVGCGTRVENIEAPTPEAAVELSVLRVQEFGWRDSMAHDVNSATLIPSADAIDLVPLLDLAASRAAASRSSAAAAEDRAEDLAEYDRLRRKLGYD